MPLQGIGQGFESPHLHHKTKVRFQGKERPGKPELKKRFLRSIEGSKAERSSKETEENVDNRIQYVGQIASEGKHSKKLLDGSW